jgi:protocatechuate 3,4-dioxygenase beta subunit
MDNDDRTVGRILSRREVLKLAGLTGAALAVSCGPAAAITATPRSPGETPSPGTTATTSPGGTVPACVVRPETTEGPYFVDEQLVRSDIRSDPSTGRVSEGARLELTIQVSRVGDGSCTPLEGAVVDLWHCDARGVYSDVQDPRFNTIGQKFLRGSQVTDANGRVSFTTIYPGWYQGRTVHMHFKIRSAHSEFTSQLYFDDSFTDGVFLEEPYAARGQRTVRNADDGVYQNGGQQLTLEVEEVAGGYAGAFDIGLQLD